MYVLASMSPSASQRGTDSHTLVGVAASTDSDSHKGRLVAATALDLVDPARHSPRHREVGHSSG